MMKTHFYEVLKTSLAGGTISGIISGVLNYFILPFPETATGNAVGHTFGGFFCGTITAVTGILIFLRKYGTEPRKSNN